MDDAVVCFAVIAGWLGFNGIIAAALTYCAPGERLWRRPPFKPASRGRSYHHSEGETTVLRVVRPT
jgi:hypothetical protein